MAMAHAMHPVPPPPPPLPLAPSPTSCPWLMLVRTLLLPPPAAGTPPCSRPMPCLGRQISVGVQTNVSFAVFIDALMEILETFQLCSNEQCRRRPEKPLRCTHCRCDVYCSKSCQTRDWKRHKAKCLDEWWHYSIAEEQAFDTLLKVMSQRQVCVFAAGANPLCWNLLGRKLQHAHRSPTPPAPAPFGAERTHPECSMGHSMSPTCPLEQRTLAPHSRRMVRSFCFT